MSNFLEGQTHQLMNALQAAGYTPEHITKLGQYSRLSDFRLVLDEEAEIIIKLKPEPVLDFLVHVDRSVTLSYPLWVEKLEHHEFSYSGPTEYNLQDGVEQWLHDEQKRRPIKGHTIYKRLTDTNTLMLCLNLQDGRAIEQKGIVVFRKLFLGKSVFLWGSVVQSQHGQLHVPYLYDDGDSVMVGWYWLDYCMNSNSPALYFSK